MSRATECFSMYSDMSIRTIAVSSSNRNEASALVSSVLPTPVGPRNMNEPIGRFGSWRPARARDLHLHLEKLVALALQHLVDRHAGPAGHDLGDVIGGHRLVDQRAGLALFLRF